MSKWYENIPEEFWELVGFGIVIFLFIVGLGFSEYLLNLK